MKKPGVRYSYILIFVLFNCWGCAHIASMIEPQEMQAAKELFLQKNYKDAATAFSRIQSQTTKDSLRQRALLGHACSKILLAENEVQSREVMQLWETWCSRQPNTFHTEELCTFLTPVVERWSNPKKKRIVKKSKKRKSLSQGSSSSEKSDIGKVLASQEKELKKLRNQIKEKDQNIEELNIKIKALEDISQEIEQKKKGINFQ